MSPGGREKYTQPRGVPPREEALVVIFSRTDLDYYTEISNAGAGHQLSKRITLVSNAHLLQLRQTTCAREGELILLQKSEYPEIKASQCRLNACHVINRIEHPGEKRREKQPASLLTSSWTHTPSKVCTRLFRLRERHTLQEHAGHISRRIVGGQAAIALV